MPTDGFLTYGDLLIVALVGLAFVLRNVWDFARYNHDHVEAEDPHIAAHPLASLSAIAARMLKGPVIPRASGRPTARRGKAFQRVWPGRPGLKPALKHK